MNYIVKGNINIPTNTVSNTMSNCKYCGTEIKMFQNETGLANVCKNCESKAWENVAKSNQKEIELE
jgi:hypothetical protein